MGNVHMEATQINYRGGSVKKSVADEIDSLKSGLTNVQSDVKLNTQDLTTPSRSINLMTLPITITKSGSSTGTVTNNDGVITLNGEFLNEEIITVTCADCIAPNDAIIAYMNNVALTKANISFYNGSTKHDYFSFAIPNRIIYTAALANVVGKTINRYDITFTETTTLDNFTFSLMMAHNGQDVSTYAPYIPSVDARMDAVESGIDLTANVTVGDHVTIDTTTAYIIKVGCIVVCMLPLTATQDLSANDEILLRNMPIPSKTRLVPINCGSKQFQCSVNTSGNFKLSNSDSTLQLGETAKMLFSYPL